MAATSWNIQAAIQYLTQNACAKSQHKCAAYVRKAIEAGGLSTAGRPVSAYMYVDFLPKIGFTGLGSITGKVNQANWTKNSAKPGDIAVMAHGEHGHIAMYNGTQWISDFKQNNMWVYGGDGTCTLWRFGGTVDGSLAPILDMNGMGGVLPNGMFAGTAKLELIGSPESQPDDIIMTELSNIKTNLIKEILESAGCFFDNGRYKKYSQTELLLKNKIDVKTWKPESTSKHRYKNTITNDESTVMESVIENATQFGLLTDMSAGNIADFTNLDPSQIATSQFKGKASDAINALFGCTIPMYDPRIQMKQAAHCDAPAFIESQLQSVKLPILGNCRLHKKLIPNITAVDQELQQLKKSGLLPYNIVNGGTFYYRTINNNSAKAPYRLSNHSFGTAIDINVSKNPFVSKGKALVSGQSGCTTPEMRAMDHPVVQAFLKHGFGWGGTYGDYMHFSYPSGS